LTLYEQLRRQNVRFWAYVTLYGFVSNVPYASEGQFIVLAIGSMLVVALGFADMLAFVCPDCKALPWIKTRRADGTPHIRSPRDLHWRAPRQCAKCGRDFEMVAWR
jgi:hypothetical protein